jgi:hypothetical protein
VHCRTPAPDIVIVHAREIVVNERVGVDDLDGRREHAAIGRASNSLVCCGEQERAQSLSTAEEAVANRVGDARLDPIELGAAELGERVVDRAAIEREGQPSDLTHAARRP